MVANTTYDLQLNNQFKNCAIGYSAFQKASTGHNEDVINWTNPTKMHLSHPNGNEITSCSSDLLLKTILMAKLKYNTLTHKHTSIVILLGQ